MIPTRSKAATLLLGAFALGALAGGAATLLAERGRHWRDTERGPSFFAERLKEDLKLTPPQVDSVTRVLERHRPTMDSIWSQVQPQFESQRQQIRTEIRSMLTPEQQRAYATLLARKDSLHRASHGNR